MHTTYHLSLCVCVFENRTRHFYPRSQIKLSLHFGVCLICLPNSKGTAGSIISGQDSLQPILPCSDWTVQCPCSLEGPQAVGLTSSHWPLSCWSWSQLCLLVPLLPLSIYNCSRNGNANCSVSGLCHGAARLSVTPDNHLEM